MFFYVNQLETSANSNYNALQTSFTLRDHHGWSSVVNYTWSHSIDNASDGQDFVANATQPDNSFRADRERDSKVPRRHGFVSHFGKHSNFAPALALARWQLTVCSRLRSGNPSTDYNFTGDFTAPRFWASHLMVIRSPALTFGQVSYLRRLKYPAPSIRWASARHFPFGAWGANPARPGSISTSLSTNAITESIRFNCSLRPLYFHHPILVALGPLHPPTPFNGL